MYTEEELLNTEDAEFKGIWGKTVGSRHALECVISKIKKEAGQYFVSNKDEIAQAMRNLVKTFEEDFKTCSNQLDLIIKVSFKRNKGK